MLVLAFLSPAQETNASMGSTLILAVVLTIGAVYALVLVILPVLGGIRAVRDYAKRRSIERYIAKALALASVPSITKPTSPTSQQARHITHITRNGLGTKPKPSVLTDAR